MSVKVTYHCDVPECGEAGVWVIATPRRVVYDVSNGVKDRHYCEGHALATRIQWTTGRQDSPHLPYPYLVTEVPA